MLLRCSRVLSGGRSFALKRRAAHPALLSRGGAAAAAAAAARPAPRPGRGDLHRRLLFGRRATTAYSRDAQHPAQLVLAGEASVAKGRRGAAPAVGVAAQHGAVGAATFNACKRAASGERRSAAELLEPMRPPRASRVEGRAARVGSRPAPRAGGSRSAGRSRAGVGLGDGHKARRRQPPVMQACAALVVGVGGKATPGQTGNRRRSRSRPWWRGSGARGPRSTRAARRVSQLLDQVTQRRGELQAACRAPVRSGSWRISRRCSSRAPRREEAAQPLRLVEVVAPLSSRWCRLR